LYLAIASPIPARAAPIDPDGTVHMPAMDVPFSSLASPQARQAFVAGAALARRFMAIAPADIAASRRLVEVEFGKLLAKSLAAYPVVIRPRRIGGIYTDDIAPKAGVSAANEHRVLINLHGGGFSNSARIGGKVEGVPVAAIGKIRVIAIDYRQGPENKFPAASEDVASVYRELLKQYPASNIGIYGCSAGGLLTAETVAWLQTHHLPRPGAIGIFCASASGWAGGDSTYVASASGTVAQATNSPHFAVSDVAYFSAAKLDDPLVLPIHAPGIMARFPPSLIITGTRDVSMSSAIHTHAELVKLGVEAELHVWEGMGHGFFYDPGLPESREAYDVIAHFFDRHLGR
jgi:acetyl esterase/lipase